MSFRESEAVRTEYAQTKCKTDRRAACLGKRLFELVRVLARVFELVRLSESRRARKLQEEADILQE